ncbi:MAG: DUF3341 domain-containing protein [Silvanigrellaceae bacterium]|nr:DUF3341 domain-containing protein [Silvanigrellaceae bacterium]
MGEVIKMSDYHKIFGLLAQFESAHDIYLACEKVRDKGFKHWDAHSPIPIHGLEKAMGAPQSSLAWITLAFAACGGIGGFATWSWMNAIDYKYVIGGKPFFSWESYFIPAFECTVLFGAIGTLIGLLALNKLPQLYHPLFRSEKFLRVTDDKFFISIEVKDPLFQINETEKFLRSIGATYVEVIEE